MRESNRTDRAWGGIALGITTGLLLAATASLAVAATADRYRVLSPEVLSGDLYILSLEDGNTVEAGAEQLSLDRYELGTIPAAELSPGALVEGTRAFAVSSEENATDLIVPEAFTGTAFVIPHYRGSHKYFFLSPSGTAQVTVTLGTNSYNVSALQGLVNEFDAGSNNAIAGRITSDAPILVAHVGYSGSVAQDAYPVPPAATSLWGVRSQTVVVGALADNTSISVYASDAATGNYLLDAGEYVSVAVGASTANGQGAALHLQADGPIAAVQVDDSDGTDASGFWQSDYLAVRHGIPIDAQYAAVACPQANTSVTLYQPGEVPDIRSCQSSGTTPGKLYFGAATSGMHIVAGAYVESNKPVYLMYEASASEDEHNLLGYASPSTPEAPILTAISSPTNDNPVAVGGSGTANTQIRLYVNGELQDSVTSAGDGSFSFEAVLLDGVNAISASAWDGSVESAPSATASVEYINNLPRSQSGSIVGTVVWTPGFPTQAYTITAGDLTIAAGAELVLQPGTQVRFGSGRKLTVNGTLVVNGIAGSEIMFTSDLAAPTRGSWTGIVIGVTATDVMIEHALIEWAVTAVNLFGVSGTVRNSTIRNFSQNGIYVSGSGASGSLLKGNTIDNGAGNCIQTYDSSPAIKSNLLTNCLVGIYVYRVSSPMITDGNEITGNYHGVQVDGANYYNPQPVVTGNQIYDNFSRNYVAQNFTTSGSTLLLNAHGNWWGSTDPTTINDKIYDLSNSYTNSRLPTVDYSDFLDDPDGAPVTGNYLIGPLAQTSTTLTPGATYDVLGTLFVPDGKDLMVSAGTVLRFHGFETRLVVDGDLTIQGTSGNEAVLTSGQAQPTSDRWAGLLVRASGSLIEHALIEWAQTGVDLSGVSATVRDSTIRNSVTYGIYANGSGASSSLFKDNTIDNLNDQGSCIYLNASSPAIEGNLLTNCSHGLVAYRGSSPTVTDGNEITSNSYGLWVHGAGSSNPQPVVTGNQIYDNDNYNYYTTAFMTSGWTLLLNARGNWWGSTDPTTINAKIYDLSDSSTNSRLPTVDYGDFLDGPGGSSVTGNYLIGPLTQTSTTLTPGATYEVLGTLLVRDGEDLTVPAGTVLRFHGNAKLIVDGDLTIQGSYEDRVHLTSGRNVPAKGDWYGIDIRNSATSVVIDHASIEWAYNAVNVADAGATITNSLLRNFSNAGVRMINATTGSEISNNYIDNYNGQGYGIYLSASSPLIADNRIHRTAYGIYLIGSSGSIITGNAITQNGRGIYLDGNGSNSASAVPNPVITGNDIFANTIAQMEVYRYGAGNPVVIDATNNWWGTADPQAGQQIRFISSPAAVLDFTSPAAGLLTGLVSDAPEVTITSPEEGARLITPASLDVRVSAFATVGKLTQIDIYDGEELLISRVLPTPVPSTTFTLTISPPEVGTHVFTATAMDDRDVVTTSSPVMVTVLARPTVSIVAPAPDTVFVAPAFVILHAVAESENGPITEVEFLANGSSRGIATAEPYSVQWGDVGVGTYTLTARATDIEGIVTTSEPVTMTVASEPSVAVTSQSDGASINDDVITTFGGTVQAPPNSSVSVNGRLAEIAGGQFFVNNLPLQPGSNILEVVVTTADGLAATQMLTVDSTGRAPFGFEVSPPSGFAPLNAQLRLINRDNVPFTRIEFSCLDDGVYFLPIPNAPEICTYWQPGLYTARVNVIVQEDGDPEEIIYTATQAIWVTSLQAMDGTLRGVYLGMLHRLRAGNVNGALRAVTSGMNEKYELVFNSIPNLAAAVDQLGTIEDGMIGPDFAEYVVVRETDQGPTGYLIYLIRGEDGIWRIDGM